MRIRPYRTSQNVAAGVVITFVDITERKRAEQQLLISRTCLATGVSLGRPPFLGEPINQRFLNAEGR